MNSEKMSRPVVCNKPREEFTSEQIQKKDFLCDTCNQHPNWHERTGVSGQAQGNINLLLPTSLF